MHTHRVAVPPHVSSLAFSSSWVVLLINMKGSLETLMDRRLGILPQFWSCSFHSENTSIWPCGRVSPDDKLFTEMFDTHNRLSCRLKIRTRNFAEPEVCPGLITWKCKHGNLFTTIVIAPTSRHTTLPWHDENKFSSITTHTTQNKHLDR